MLLITPQVPSDSVEAAIAKTPPLTSYLKQESVTEEETSFRKDLAERVCLIEVFHRQNVFLCCVYVLCVFIELL